jgi:hypothetical protein
MVEAHVDKVFKTVLLTLLLLGIRPLSSARADNLADEVATRNRAAVESIQTLSCRYSSATYSGDGKLIDRSPELQYWRSGMRFRSNTTTTLI